MCKQVFKKPDLKRIKYLTDKGKDRCNDTEHIEAYDIIANLMNILREEDRNAVNEWFWSLKIKTGSERIVGQIEVNLWELEKYLLSRGINSHRRNRVRIYKLMVDVFESKIAEPPTELTLQEKLEYRKVRLDDILACISGPFTEPTIRRFDIDNDEKQNISLEEKMKKAHFPPNIMRYVVESRNKFAIRFRKDMIHANDYLSGLRWKIWSLCVSRTIQAEDGYTDQKMYSEIWSELKILANQERASQPPVEVDFDYLHGMLCQLTAECDNVWLQTT